MSNYKEKIVIQPWTTKKTLRTKEYVERTGQKTENLSTIKTQEIVI